MIDTAHSVLESARQAIKERDYQQAKGSFHKLIGTALEAEGFFGLGWLAKAEGRHGDAANYFERARAFDPRHAPSHYHLARLAELDGRTADAVSGYRLAIASQPDYRAAREGLQRLGIEPPPVVERKVDGTGVTDRPRVMEDPVRGNGGWVEASGTGPNGRRPRMHPAEEDDDPPYEPRRRSDPRRFGVYEYLRGDRAPLSRHAVAVLARLEIDRYPTVLSFFSFGMPSSATGGKIFSRGLVAVIAIVVLGLIGISFALQIGSGRQPGPTPGDVFEVVRRALPTIGQIIGRLVPLLVIALILWPVFRFVRHITTRLRIERGRLQVESGLLTRTLTNVELWRVQSIELERRGLQLLTGDGTLVFHAVSGSEPVKVTGIARGRDLVELYEELLDLVFLLRTNQSIKGIVQ